MKFKKFVTVLMAASIVSGSGANLVMADTYQEIEKTNIAGLASSLSELLESAASASSTEFFGDVSLELADTGRALLGMISSDNLSWAENIGINYCVSSKDGMEGIAADFYVNNTGIFSMEYYLDTTTMQYYICFPTIHPAYVTSTLGIALDDSYTDLDQLILDITKNPMTLCPEGTVVEELLNRYGQILVEGFVDGTSIEDTISVEGISMDCQLIEGQMFEENLFDFTENLLTTAKDDEQLKEIIEFWDSLIELSYDENMDTYTEFQLTIEELLDELADEEITDDTSYISSKIWQDSNGTIVGREISLYEGAQITPFLTYKLPSSGDDKGFYLEFNAEDDSFAISGKGNTIDGKFNGTYDFMYNDVVMFSMDVIDADEKAAEDGSAYGSYKFTLQPGIGEDMYQYYSSFGLTADLSSYGADFGSALGLTLTMSDADIATLRIHGGPADYFEFPDFTSTTNVLSLDSEEDMDTYCSELNLSLIFDSCEAAGIPDEIVSMVSEEIYNAIYETEDADLDPEL